MIDQVGKAWGATGDRRLFYLSDRHNADPSNNRNGHNQIRHQVPWSMQFSMTHPESVAVTLSNLPAVRSSNWRPEIPAEKQIICHGPRLLLKY